MFVVALATLVFGAGGDAQCFRNEAVDGVGVETYVGDRACIHFDGPRQFDGIWINQHEGSVFFQGAKELPDTDGQRGNVWLTIDKQSETPAWLPRRADGHVYRLRFVGEAAHDMHRKFPNGYGHMGGAAGLVIVDHVIDAVDLGPLPHNR